MCCFVVVGVVVCLAHRGLGGLGGANAWRRFVVDGVELLVRVGIGV
jgi:hypothetical protein